MFGKEDARKKLIARTALKLYMAVLAGDKSELYDLMTGPESDDDGTAGALMLFWAIAREVPSVRAGLGEAAAATDTTIST